MLYRGAPPDDWLTCSASQAFVHLRRSTGSAGIPRHGLFVSCAEGKNCVWRLRSGVQNLLRPQGTETPRPGLWGYPHLSGGRTAAGMVPQLRGGETGEAALGGRSAVLPHTVRLVRGAAVSHGDDAGCRSGTALGLEDRQGVGPTGQAGTIASGGGGQTPRAGGGGKWGRQKQPLTAAGGGGGGPGGALGWGQGTRGREAGIGPRVGGGQGKPAGSGGGDG